MKEASLLLHKVKWFASCTGVFPLRDEHLSCMVAHERLEAGEMQEGSQAALGKGLPTHVPSFGRTSLGRIPDSFSRSKMERWPVFCNLEMHILIPSLFSASCFVLLSPGRGGSTHS